MREIRRPVQTPNTQYTTPTKSLSSVRANTMSTKSILGAKHENNEIMSHLLNELDSMKCEMSSSKVISPRDEFKRRSEYLRILSQSNIFKTERDKTEYLIKELENANVKITILTDNIKTLRNENDTLKFTIRKDSYTPQKVPEIAVYQDENKKLKAEVEQLKKVVADQNKKLDVFKKQVIEQFCNYREVSKKGNAVRTSEQSSSLSSRKDEVRKVQEHNDENNTETKQKAEIVHTVEEKPKEVNYTKGNDKEINNIQEKPKQKIEKDESCKQKNDKQESFKRNFHEEENLKQDLNNEESHKENNNKEATDKIMKDIAKECQEGKGEEDKGAKESKECQEGKENGDDKDRKIKAEHQDVVKDNVAN